VEDNMTDTNRNSEVNGDVVQPSEDEPQSFILSRARSEVHLLLDNISANPDVTIASLVAAAPPAKTGLSDHWIEDICKITWPPDDDDSIGELAAQAALLIRAKDYLNGLAKPASGATIAFTLMVTQEETSRSRRRTAGATHTPSRTSLAAEAYPELLDKANTFRKLLSRTLIASFAALVLTLLLSWYLAVGNAALADYSATYAALVEADGRVSVAQSALNGDSTLLPSPGQPIQRQATPQPRAPAPGGAVATSASQAPPVYLLHPCLPDTPSQSYPSAELRDACFARKLQADRFLAIRQGLDTWALWFGPDRARWLANMLGSGLLPVLYGFLGAIAAVVRSLSGKIKSSLLSPRDARLTFQQLALGAVVGACISLFINVPGGDAGGATLLGPVALSSSAIAFVAGFGVDAVFQALEALISRIFNIAPAGGVARPDNRPTP
jgi:hypothetical protein